MKTTKRHAAVAPREGRTDPKPKFRMRWVLAHEPTSLFEPAAREFARLVDAGTGGEVRVDVLAAADYGPSRSSSAVDMADEVASGRLEMAQTYTHVFGRLHAPLLAVDAPFLFRSHEHATKVLDGEIGRGLLSPLQAHGLRGLAFTYSGGYRILGTMGREIRKPGDFRGLRVRTSPNPVAIAAMEALGALPVPATLDRIASLTRGGLIDAAETTFPRYWLQGQKEILPIVNETGHSLLTTVVAINEAFFQSLPPEHRAVVVESARTIAVQERDFSVREGEKARAEAVRAGLRVVTPSDGESALIESAVRPAYGRIAGLVGTDLIAAIRAAA